MYAGLCLACVVMRGRCEGMPDDEADLEGWLPSCDFVLGMTLLDLGWIAGTCRSRG